MSQVQSTLGVSERRVCRALGVSRSSVRYTPQPRSDESLLTRSIVRLAGQYGRYGYRRVHALLKSEGWQVSHGWVMRLWRREGLKVPAKQPRRGRLWLNDGSCMRLRPEHRSHVWSWDFVFIRTLSLAGSENVSQTCSKCGVSGNCNFFVIQMIRCDVTCIYYDVAFRY